MGEPLIVFLSRAIMQTTSHQNNESPHCRLCGVSVQPLSHINSHLRPHTLTRPFHWTVIKPSGLVGILLQVLHGFLWCHHPLRKEQYHLFNQDAWIRLLVSKNLQHKFSSAIHCRWRHKSTRVMVGYPAHYSSNLTTQHQSCDHYQSVIIATSFNSSHCRLMKTMNGVRASFRLEVI